MNTNNKELFRQMLAKAVNQWEESGLPGRSALEDRAKELKEWKEAQGVSGLWDEPPLIITATLDDAFGQGISLINLFSEVAGLRVKYLGLERTAREVIEECKKENPDLLGLTVLQFDTGDDVKQISQNLPKKTCFTAGGPVFKAGGDFAQEIGIDYVARNVGRFLDFLLKFKRDEKQ